MSDLLLMRKKLVVFDGFNRADNALTLGNADTGQAWIPISNCVYGIDSNKAYLVSGEGARVVYVDCGESDCVVSTTLFTIANYLYLVFRYIDTENRWTCGPESGVYGLYRVVSGVTTKMASIPGRANGDVLSVRAKSDKIEIMVNGISKSVIYDSANEKATKHGLRTTSYTARFDDFSVEAI